MGILIWIIGAFLALGIMAADDSETEYGFFAQLILCALIWPLVLGYAIGTIAYGKKK